MATNPLKINQAEAQTSVEELKGITASESQKLKAANILTLGDLWICVGADTLELNGFDKLAASSRIPGDRLIELLPTRLINILNIELLRRTDELNLQVSIPDNAASRSNPNLASIWRGALLAVRKFGPWFRRHMLDWILIFCFLSLAFLTLRAAGVLASYPTPLGLTKSVVITKRNLKAGDVLQIGRDLSYAQLLLKENYFKSTSGLEGLILRRDVSSQRPVRSDDLLRLQVVATKDIPTGAKITKDAVTLAWSAYDPKALLRTEDVEDHKSLYPIRKDNVVLDEVVIR